MVPLDAGWAADAAGGSLALAIPVALLAGAASFFSPCVLPLLPGYLSYATGLSVTEATSTRPRRGRLLLGTALFVVGFAVVFMIAGAVVGGLGQGLRSQQRLLEVIGGVACVVLGLIFAGLIPLGRGEVRPARIRRAGIAAAPLLGMAFAIGWTPCIGPTLAVVLTLALNEGSAPRGALLAFCYALGLGVPFVVAGLAFAKLAATWAWVKRHQRGIQVIGGLLLVVVGLLLITGLWAWLMRTAAGWLAGIGVPL